jgi:hypothetical protein
MTLFRSALSSIFLSVLPVAGLVMLCGMTTAHAQVTSLSGAQTQIAGQIVYIPKLVAVFAYVIGTYFAADGLLKLKNWMSEPEKNPLNAAIFRLVVASLLIALPKVISISNATIFGGSNGAPTSAKVPMQNLNAF